MKGDSSSNKLTVVGKVDPEKLRERVQSKTKKKVELISPQPKPKDKDKDGDKKKDEPKKDEEKKPKEVPHFLRLYNSLFCRSSHIRIGVYMYRLLNMSSYCCQQPVETTLVLKTRLHCEGCIQKIRRIVYKVKGKQSILLFPLI